MRFEELPSLSDRPVRDVYGRRMGTVVGVYADPFGKITRFAIDEGKGVLVEYPAERFFSEGGELVVTPSWRLDVEYFNRSIGSHLKRSNALEELALKNELATHLVEEMREEHYRESAALRETYHVTVEALKARAAELDDTKKRLEKVLGRIKVLSLAGEIDDETFRSATNSMNRMLAADEKERSDIRMVMENLVPPEARQIQPPESGDGEGIAPRILEEVVQ